MIMILVAIAVIVIDQFSKYLFVQLHVVGSLGYSGSMTDLDALRSFLAHPSVSTVNQVPKQGDFLVLSFTPNDAALFGLGHGNEWAVRLLIGLTSAFLLVILFFSFRTVSKQTKWSAVTLGLLIGGSIGNLYDRIVFGYVRDLIYAKFINFPIFNIADAAICVAVFMLCIQTFFMKNNLFDTIEDDFRDLFRMPTRLEAEQIAKERRQKKLSRFEEEIPMDEDDTEE